MDPEHDYRKSVFGISSKTVLGILSKTALGIFDFLYVYLESFGKFTYLDINFNFHVTR